MAPKTPRLAAHVFLPVVVAILLSTFALTSAHAQELQRLRREERQSERPTASGRIFIASGGVLPAATAGNPYSQVLAVRGGAAPYQFRIASGSLPSGLTLNSTTGSISGTSTATGSYTFEVVVTDLPRSERGEKQLSISVTGTAPTTSVSVSPSVATVVSGNTQQFSATVSNTSNQGVTWRASVGEISSTGLYRAPQLSSNTGVTITATSIANSTAVGKATVTVTAATPTPITVSVSPTSAAVTSGGTQQFTALVNNTSNTSVTWKASAGSVSSTGLFTAPQVSATTYVKVTATSVASPIVSASVTVTVTASAPAPAALTITTLAVPGGTTGTPYGAALNASGGTAPYTWSIGSGSLPTGITLSTSGMLSGTTSQTGQFSFVAQVADSSSGVQHATQSLTLSMTTAAPTGSTDGPAQLPRVYLQTKLANTPANGQVWNVSSTAGLQPALNSAACGDTIMLQPGVVYTGVFTFPAKSCDAQHWIIVRTAAPDTALPPEGVRLTPCYAGVASLPGRPPFNCTSTQKVLPTLMYSSSANGPVVFANGANHYRLLGVEITRTVGTGVAGTLVSMGAVDSLVFDRIWLHGTASDETHHGLQLGASTNVAVVDSFFTDLHCTSVTGTCTDAQAISGGNSPSAMGPYKIVNNFLEASGENIMFGGGPALATPADIEIRRNHLFKPLIWQPGQPGFVGGVGGSAFVVKNHFELKNAQRVLFEANILENNWGGFTQKGFSIQLVPTNQWTGTSNVCSICQVTDVTIRYNTISHVGAGLNMSNVITTGGGIGLAGGRYSIHDITIDDVSAGKYTGTGTLFLIMNNWPSNVPNSITINHVTAFPDASVGKLFSLGNVLSNPTMYGLVFTNNLVGAGRYPVWDAGLGSTSCAISDVPVTSIPLCFKTYAFSSNAIMAAPAAFGPSTWPTGNYFPSTSSTVLFSNYNNAIGGNYQLLSSSPYKNAGSDGKDLGADITAIQAATAGVY